MRVIEAETDLDEGLAALLRRDARLEPVARLAGPLPLRRRPADFSGLAHIVVAQQVSVASATAIYARLESLLDPFDTATMARHDDAALAAAGLSRAKIRTLRAVAAAIDDGLDLGDLARMPAAAAHSRLCALHGIGPWTADIFLLFCAGHADVFPAGDLALRVAVADGLGLSERPSIAETARLAEHWRPWRGVAARLFWAYYRAMRAGREAVPV